MRPDLLAVSLVFLAPLTVKAIKNAIDLTESISEVAFHRSTFTEAVPKHQRSLSAANTAILHGHRVFPQSGRRREKSRRTGE